ncbi:stage II sporulation protein M [Nocardia sp. NPDC059177]|uniref:stage II sporulation protein M n=1 Tax=Nocardia sp. NPDC059177 TaxID=3346759 RepID=UPI0036A3E33B
MDTDAYSWARQRSWVRLDQLVRQRKLTGAEADELVALYRATSQQLAKVQGHHPDPELVAGLSGLLARARGRVLAARSQPWREVGRFFTHHFPEAVYRAWPWWVGTTVIFLGVAGVIGVLVDRSRATRAALGIPEGDLSTITGPGGSFETYYSEHPNDAFAAQVWTHNSWVSAIALFTGVLILPAVYAMFMNALNLGITGGLMADAGRLDSFFGFILPHGTLELTALFVAGGVGLKLGWTLVDPGRRSRAAAMAHQGRATATVALGLVVVLLVCGLLEGFVTPSPLPAPVRIAFGFAAEALFLVYVFGIGRRVAEERDARSAAAPALPDPAAQWLAPVDNTLDRA